MNQTAHEILKSANQLSRRAFLIGFVQIGVIIALGARMRFLQVKEAKKYRLLAEENRINVHLLPPVRGIMFDRGGKIIADNVPNYRIIMVRESATDVETVLEQLQKLIYIKPTDLEKARKQLKRRSAFVPVTITENLNWKSFAKVAANAPTLPGISTEVGLSRIYSQKENLAHVIGYVGPVSDHYLERTQDPDPLLKIPRFQVGKTGVEAQIEQQLRGSAGHQSIEVNAVGRVMRELARAEGKPGAAVKLTINSEIQNFALERMDGLSASAVVIDCESGDLLAVGSSPSFDPNLFVRGISSDAYNGLRNNVFGPLRAKAVQGTYAPASTFKMVTALAALESGVLRLDETVFCPGHLDVAGNRFHCWKRQGHGAMNVSDSISQSCDVFFYAIGQKVGIDKISDMARRFGLGQQYDLPLSAVSRGVVPTPDWKQRSFDKGWLLGDTVNASIGQGYVLASPLQLAVMAARLGTGRTVQPRLIQNINGEVMPLGGGTQLDVDPVHLAVVQKAMFEVANTKDGTAFSKRITTQELRMAGKTGTAQVRRITAKERTTGVIPNEDLTWGQRDHALFVNYAPHDNPKISVAVVVEHGGSGSSVAAPIARDITLFALTGKMPDLKHYPTELHNKIKREQKELAPRLIDWNKIGTSERAKT
jgi:penicillin-binding protein 2